MDPKAKQLLKKMVDDLQDLRASLVVIAGIQSRQKGLSVAAGQDAKNLAIDQSRQAYEELRKEIDTL